MKKKGIIFIVVACMLFSGIAWGQEVSNQAFLKYDLDEWGILALHASGDVTEGMKLEGVEKSEISTDHEAYIMGLLALGRDAGQESSVLAGSQMKSGKFADYIDGTGDELLNAHIWGIIALESSGNNSYDKEKAQEWLLANQNDDGGFPVYKGMKASDGDLTAMAIVALDLIDLEGAELSIEKAFEFIETNNEYRETAEGIVWEIIARKQTGRRIYQSLKDRLEAYKTEKGLYRHLKTMSSENYMASWHGIWAEAEMDKRLTVFDGFKKANSLIDINSNTKAYKSIMSLVEKGVLSGYPDSTFKPDNPVKRGEFVKMLIYAMDNENEKAKDVGFADMKSHWASNYVNLAVRSELFNGISDTEFDPESGITGAQLAAVAVRAKGLEDEAKAFNGDKWYDGYVYYAWLYDLQYEGFDIEKEATRAQCAELIDILY